MIKFKDVTFGYQKSLDPIIRNLSTELTSGHFNLVIGKTGSGKSTLINLINGTTPHLTGGYLLGQVEVFNMNTKDYSPRDFAQYIGLVNQDPRNAFVTSMVEDELAYSMECLGTSPKIMRQRIDETVDLLGLDEILHQSLETLSAGQQQRVAIASVLVNRPKVLILDEPTSALDPAAAEDILSSLQRLVHDLGITIVAAEHRLERVLQYADKVLYVPGSGKQIEVGTPAEIMRISEVVPPIVQLSKALNWQPIALSVRAARGFAEPLIEKLEHNPNSTKIKNASVVCEIKNLTIKYGENIALDQVSINLHEGETLAILGRNGAGKSTLLNSIAGLTKPYTGFIKIQGKNPIQLIGREFVNQIGLVPQEPADLLMQTSIQAECELTDKAGKLPKGSTLKVVKEFLPDIDLGKHPLDLSEGQRLMLALTLVMTNKPKLLLLDEPTRGLDYLAKVDLLGAISQIKRSGTSVVIATHDVELVAELDSDVAILAAGKLVARGAAREVLLESISFTPQIARVFAPMRFLTIKDVTDAIKLAG